jgi:mannose-1-phosphate guanylyltransferase
VKTVILAVNVQPDAMKVYIAEAEKKYGIRIIFSQEDVPMGTAGPLALPDAYNALTADNAPFFMFNSDVICDFPLAEMLAFHRNHGGEGTIMVTEVADPSKYGVVLSEESGQIKQFIEKPQTFVSNKINAGIYLFNVDILKRVPKNTPTSIEREVFPKIAAEKKLYSLVLKGYWMDIGQPKDYLTGQVLHLAYVRKTAPELLTKAAYVKDNVIVHPTAKIGAGAIIGPDVVIGANCVIEDGARIKRSTILAGSVVKASAFVSSTIVGWKSTIGTHARVCDSVLGEDVTIAAEISVHDVQVCPHKGVGANESGKIIM